MRYGATVSKILGGRYEKKVIPATGRKKRKVSRANDDCHSSHSADGLSFLVASQISLEIQGASRLIALKHTS